MHLHLYSEINSVAGLCSGIAVTIFGLVVGADNALLSHEAGQRIEETAIRRRARMELAKRGIVGTETEIARWKAENLNPETSRTHGH